MADEKPVLVLLRGDDELNLVKATNALAAKGLRTYTTFSTFSLETLLLVEDGQVLRGLAYVAASLALGLGAVFLGALAAPRL